MEYKNKFRSRFLVGVLVVVALALIVSATVLIMMGVNQNKYNSVIKSANHYFTTGDYQNAIVEYKNAIAIDNKKESAYLNLASVYINMGNYEAALSTIDRGLAVISSEKLMLKRTEIEQLWNAAKQQELKEVQQLTAEEIQQYSADASLENNAFDMVAAYTYTEYYRDYGNVAATGSNGKASVKYAAGGFTTVYYDINNEKVVDASTNQPYANAKPVEVSFDSLYKIFSTSSEKFVVSYAKLQELFGSTLAFCKDEQSGMHYITAEYKKCKIYIETDESGNIISENAWNKIEPLNRTRFESDENAEGEVKGYVQDAVTGKGMKAEMKVRERGKKAGAVIDELTSGKDGSYTYGGKQGKYTVEVSAKGYITEYLDIEIVKGQTKTGKNIVLSPEVAEGEIRIVLTWGSSPTDLDAYAGGKSSTGKNFNINFTCPRVSDVGNLDVDDTSGYGPETITITDVGASFEYYVVDFRNEGTLGGCGATVKVYLPGESSAITYKVPAGSGRLWRVFNYENGEITQINRITNDPPTQRTNK